MLFVIGTTSLILAFYIANCMSVMTDLLTRICLHCHIWQIIRQLNQCNCNFLTGVQGWLKVTDQWLYINVPGIDTIRSGLVNWSPIGHSTTTIWLHDVTVNWPQCSSEYRRL